MPESTTLNSSNIATAIRSLAPPPVPESQTQGETQAPVMSVNSAALNLKRKASRISSLESHDAGKKVKISLAPAVDLQI